MVTGLLVDRQGCAAVRRLVSYPPRPQAWRLEKEKKVREARRSRVMMHRIFGLTQSVTQPPP